MLIKEYRIPMPMSVEEYRIAQLYMIQVSGFSPPPPPPQTTATGLCVQVGEGRGEVESLKRGCVLLHQDKGGGEHGRKSHRASVALQSRWCDHMPVDCVPFHNLVQIHSHMCCKNTH